MINSYSSSKGKIQKGLKCIYIYTNADLLLNMIDDLLMFIASDEPIMMMFTEVIPKAQRNPIALAQSTIKGYEMYTNFNHTEENLGGFGIR